jgi:hypothetical protein
MSCVAGGAVFVLMITLLLFIFTAYGIDQAIA